MSSVSAAALGMSLRTLAIDKNAAASLKKFVQAAAIVGSDGLPTKQPVDVLDQLCDARDAAHNLAVLLLNNPCHWKMSDSVRLQIARQMLEISAQCSEFTIRYLGERRGIPNVRIFRNWPDTRLERALPTWDLWVKLLDAQARLGRRADFERTAAQLSRDVDARCNKMKLESQTADAAQFAGWARAFAHRNICQQRAQLHAVRGEWSECAQQHAASVIAIEGQQVSAEPWKQRAPRGSLRTAVPSTADLGIKIELASQMAALSHARLQQSTASPSAPLALAVLSAQHAVALLAAEAVPSAMSEIITALRAEAMGVATVHIGSVPYSELLSAPMLDRVRQQQVPPRGLSLALRRLIPATVERICLLEPLTVTQARAHTRLSLVAAVYQQLGLTLRAAGQGAEAQRAFDFADELAAMRPDLRAEPRAKWMIG